MLLNRPETLIGVLREAVLDISSRRRGAPSPRRITSMIGSAWRNSASANSSSRCEIVPRSLEDLLSIPWPADSASDLSLIEEKLSEIGLA